MKNKHALVTGGTGFVGSHLCEQLVARGAKVTVFDNRTRKPPIYVTGPRYVRVDVSDYGRLIAYGALAQKDDGQFDYIFNLAAKVAGVHYNSHHQLLMFDKNLRVQTSVARYAGTIRTARLLQVSSVCVYASDYNDPANEQFGRTGEPEAANCGYAWSKRAGELAALWSDSASVVIVRPTNAYGPRDDFSERAHVIPSLVKRAVAEQQLSIMSDGSELREFIYVDDLARGMIAAALRGRDRQVYNLGTNGRTKMSILALAQLIQELCERDGDIPRGAEPFGDLSRSTDSSKAERELDWRADTSMRDGLQKTIDWYRSEFA